MGLLLAIDTALDACTVALARGGALVVGRYAPMRRGQAEALAPMIDAVMAEAGEAPSALDAVAVTVGPGAFTGMRIGIAAARGLALALDRPAFGLTTAQAIACAQPDGPSRADGLLVAIESKRSDLYLAAFAPVVSAGDVPRPIAPPVACPPDRMVDVVRAWLPAGMMLAGDGAARAAGVLDGAGIAAAPAGGPDLPTPAALARLADAHWRAAATDGRSAPPEPLYLRAPDATPPRPPAWRGA